MQHRLQRALAAGAMAIAALASSTGVQSRTKAEWLTDGYDKERTSWQRDETRLSPASVGGMKLLWKLRLDKVYLVTCDGHLYAFGIPMEH